MNPVNDGGPPSINVTININVTNNGTWNQYFYGFVPGDHYTVTIQQIDTQGAESMTDQPKVATKKRARAIPRPGPNDIPVGGTGTFVAQLNNNGVPVDPVAPWAWTTDDAQAVITPDPSDPTGGTVEISIPAGDPATQVVITASTTDPTGATVSASLTVPVSTVPAIYTVVITQTA